MQDLEFTLDNGESIKVNFSEGRSSARIFIVKEHEHQVAIAIEIEGEEIFVLEISNGTQEMRITKDKR